MKINSVSFCANIKREAIYGADIKKLADNPSLEQILNEYDNEINYYENKKKSAKELDEFMHSDKVTEKTANLPREDYIEIYSRPQWNTKNSNHRLYYLTKNQTTIDKLLNGSTSEENIFYYSVQEKDGEIDKKGILSWLDRITGILKGN